LGKPHYFLGVQVVRSPKRILLTQYKYVHDPIHKFHIHIAKPIHTPSLSITFFTLTNEELLADPTEYRIMVGALKYWTITRPDIAYGVHIVS